MTNTSIMELQYNLTKIISKDVINDPASWAGAFNQQVGGWIFFGIILALGLILFFTVRKVDNVSDAQAGMYAGFMISVLGTFLFLVSLPLDPTTKLFSWAQLVPCIVITAIMIFVYKSSKTY